MELILPEVIVFGIRVVENLDFHPGVCCVTLTRIVDAETAVSARRQFEIEVEHIVGIRLFCHQILPLGRADEDSIFNDISPSGPATEVLAIE